MKVLVIGHSYAAPYNREDKLKRLAQREEIELGVVFPSNWYDRQLRVSRRYQRTPADLFYKIYPLRVCWPGLDSWYSYFSFSLYRVISRFKPDIIHVEQEPWSQILFQVAAFNKLLGHKKLIFFTWENLERELSPVWRFFRFFNLRNSNYALCGNREAEQLVRKYGFRASTQVLPQFGVDENRFHSKEVSLLKKKLNLEGFVVGFVGRLVEEKGVDTLARAFSEIRGNSTLVLLTSMDKTSHDSVIQRVASNNRVRIINSVPHEEFPEYMNLFDVLVMPSETTPTWKEQFGRVMIEAMACGVPVIGSSSGAIPEVLGKAGLIFQERNVSDLTEKIKMLQRDERLRSELSQEGLQRVRENYTHDKIVEKTVEVYKEVLTADQETGGTNKM